MPQLLSAWLPLVYGSETMPYHSYITFSFFFFLF